MKVLGIESSCDETGVALYDTERGLLGHAVHTQVAMHAAYGGVVPELASRDHVRRLIPLLERVLADAGCTRHDIDAIAYTAGPGLAGALLVGASFAEALALALDIPALPVHHLEGHLLSPLLGIDAPNFPFIALLVSGGHTQLMRVTRVGAYQLLGESLDDAAGEAFDKVAKILGLGYPGGPIIDKLARQGNAKAVDMPRLDDGGPDFSFSGVKTAVLYKWKGQNVGKGRKPKVAVPPPRIEDLAASFQEAVVDALVSRTMRAAETRGVAQVAMGGGVACNSRLREKMDEASAKRGFKLFYPPLNLCTDNAAMIAGLGTALFELGRMSNLELDAVATR